MYGNERFANISLKCICICFDECEVHLSIQIAKLRLFMCESNNNNGVKCHVSAVCFRVKAETSFIRF
jgi:hypothetical protein